MYAAALFDLDGLLIDSERVIMQAWLAVAADHRIALTERAYVQTIGLDTAESEQVLLRAFGSRARLNAAQAEVNARLDRFAAAARYPLKPGARRLLDTLAERRVRCAAVSSTAITEVERRLTAAGIRGYFAAVAGGDEVTRGKPDPEVYLLAAARLRVDISRCIALEDSPNGARAALASGADLVVVPDLVPPPPVLATRCQCVLTSLDETLHLLDQWFGARAETGSSRDPQH
jgi:HAD superfamily hydrolase (TIGR01509 family)